MTKKNKFFCKQVKGMLAVLGSVLMFHPLSISADENLSLGVDQDLSALSSVKIEAVKQATQNEWIKEGNNWYYLETTRG